MPKLGVAPGCKVALCPELALLTSPLRLAGCRVVPARAPVANASLTIVVALSKADVAELAAYAHVLADVSSLWVAVPRKGADVDGLPPPEQRAELADLQQVFVPLGLSDNKLLSFGTMLIAYRFVRKRAAAKAVGGPDEDLDLVEEKKKAAKRKEREKEKPPRPRA